MFRNATAVPRFSSLALPLITSEKIDTPRAVHARGEGYRGACLKCPCNSDKPLDSGRHTSRNRSARFTRQRFPPASTILEIGVAVCISESIPAST